MPAMARLKSWTRRVDASDGFEIRAAATELNLDRDEDQRYLQTVASKTRSRSAKAWRHYDQIGEIHYAISRSAHIAGYARIKAVMVNDDGTDGDEITDGLAAEIASQIYSPFGGVRGLIERYYALMKVPADSYLIRVRDAEGVDGYHFLSADEIEGASLETLARDEFRGIRWITLPSSGSGNGDRLVRDVEANDVLGRVWAPSHRWVEMSDSPLFALETECDLLRTLTLSLKAKLRSRFAMAGILFLPSEINEAEISGMAQTHARRVDDVLKYLIAAMTRNITNWEDATAWVPILLRGPGDAGEKIKHILMDREVLEADIKLRAELIERILFGMDISQSATRDNRDQNHWGAWATSDDERRVAIQPDLDNFCWALTRLILYRELSADGMQPEQIVRRRLKWDLSAAAVRANQQEDVRQANDRGIANAKAIMRTTGLGPDEKLEGDEYVRWVGRQVGDPQLMLWGTPEYDKLPWNVEQIGPGDEPPGPNAKSPAPPARKGPGVGDPGSPNDQDRSTRRVDRPE